MMVRWDAGVVIVTLALVGESPPEPLRGKGGMSISEVESVGVWQR
jgi:hypothetical protein